MSAHQRNELIDAVESSAELVRAAMPPPFRPLQRRIGPIVPRDGSFDYRDSPSLMGAQRVPYRTQT